MKHLFVLLMLLLSLFPINSAQAGDIAVTEPWIREAPPVAKMLAAFMTISNSSARPIQLISASSIDFAAIEIHKTTIHAGMAHMMKQPNLQIAGESRLVLEPGGYHLMLMQPKRPLRDGDEVLLQLHFNDNVTVEVKALVRKK